MMNEAYAPAAASGADTGLDFVLGAFADMYLVLDENGRILHYKNDLPLYPAPADALGRPAADIFPAAVREQITSAIRQARQKQDLVKLNYTLDDAGRAHYHLFRAAPLGRGRLALMVQDATKRKEAEREQHKLTRAVEQSSSAVIITDSRGVIEYVNPAFTRVTGYTAAEVVGKNPRFLKSGQHSPEFYTEMWRTLLNGEVWQGELINKKKNGELYWEAATITPVKDENDAIIHFLAIKDDVTERKKLAQRVEEQAKLLAAINNNIPGVIYQIVVGEKRENNISIRYVSPQITQLFGLEWAGNPAERFKRFLAAIHPEDQVRFLTSVRKAAANRTEWQFEGRFIKPSSGETIWFRGQAQPTAENGSDLVYNGILLDISEQKRAEEKLYNRRRQAEALQAAAQALNKSLDLDEALQQILIELQKIVPYEYVTVQLLEGGNLKVVAAYGFPEWSETIGHYLAIEQEKNPNVIVINTRQALIIHNPTKKYPAFYTNHPAPEKITSWMGLPLLFQGRTIGMIAIGWPEAGFYNEEHRRLAETFAVQAAVAIENARLFTEAKHSAEAARLRQRQAEVLQAAAQTLNKSLDLAQALEQILSELQKIVPYDSVTIQLLQGNRLTIAAGRGFPNWEQIHGISFDITADDNPNRLVIEKQQPVILHNPAERYAQFQTGRHAPAKIASWLGVPLLFQGRITGMLAIDKQEAGFYNEEHGRLAQTFATQAAIAIENARLFAEIQRSAKEALQAKQAAEAANRTKSEFLSRVSHELRTPLGSILGYTELFKEGTYGPVTPEQVKTAEKVIASTYYLTNLVDELLNQAQIEAGQVTLEITQFNLPQMIERIYDKMDVLARQKNLTLLTEIDANAPDVVTGDEKRVQQILVNLVSNAIKFTQAGTVKIRVYQPDEERWAMQVSDTGPGISKEAQAWIFHSFRQAENVVTRKHGGFGLGLSIVKQLTALMDGEVTVESDLGKGATFTVLLPLTIQ